MFLEHFFLVIFLSYIHPGFGITTLDDDTYETFVQMVKGEFTIPVKERTAQQNAARVRFWHNKDKLSLQGGMLRFEGKSIVMKSSPKGVIKKCFKKSKGSGTRKLYHKLTDSYSGVSERNVHEVLSKCTVHQKLNARFENRARLRPIRARARDVQIRHQIDLVDMEKLTTEHKGKVFKYVLSVMDVFSRYQWLVPLERKLSSHVARELLRITGKMEFHA